MSSTSKDILDKINNLYSSSIDRSKGIGYDKDKDILTIKNPEKLNGSNLTITKLWNIEYHGRDLSLDIDNYRWDIWNNYSKVKGYYILERELYKGDWVYVRWGKSPVNPKERREVIDKKRLKDKNRIQMDMIGVINGLK